MIRFWIADFGLPIYRSGVLFPLYGFRGFPLKAGFRVREKTEIECPKSSQKYGFCHIIAGTMFQICGDMEALGFSVQNAYKMAYGDENTASEPLPAMLRNARQAGLNL